MTDRMSSFDNLDASTRIASVIQERINLVSTHMYKQYLEYEQSTVNTKDVFLRIIENAGVTVEYLKQSFAARGISGQSIYCEYEQSKALLVMNILWHTISLTAIANDKPQALYREGNSPVFAGRIIALNGRYNDIVKRDTENEIQALLDNEVASLYVPADKSASAIIKIRHLGSKEIYISQMEAPKEFILKIIEIICGGGIYHE